MNAPPLAEPVFPPGMPKLVQFGDLLAPRAPETIEQTGIDFWVLSDLALKAAFTVPQFHTEWASRVLHLPQPLVADLLEQLRQDQLVEVLGQVGPFGYRFSISGRGRDRVKRLMEVSAYVGPAPVSLQSYRAFLEWQLRNLSEVTPEHVEESLEHLVLPDDGWQLAGLAVSSGRSLFLWGPPGNGKTSVGLALHNAMQGELWIPHCIGIESNVIRLFDMQCHQLSDFRTEENWALDQRWIRIKRPFIVVGGELTLDSFDLFWSETARFYEAPLHMKANGGTFLIDDFGRQRVDPTDLLNRWIIPLEHQVDHLAMHTGQKIQIPLKLMLTLATNLDPNKVMDPAFLRRMGYRLYLGPPSPERYAEIFRKYAARFNIPVAEPLILRLLERYRAENRELRSCEPRDLIERSRDICRFRRKPAYLDDAVLDLAWMGYFGNSPDAP